MSALISKLDLTNLILVNSMFPHLEKGKKKLVKYVQYYMKIAGIPFLNGRDGVWISLLY